MQEKRTKKRTKKRVKKSPKSKFSQPKHSQEQVPKVPGNASKRKHVAIYIRVSSSTQTTASQEPDLEAYADTQTANGEIVKWYVDKHSGRTMKRPEWERLEELYRAGKVHTLVCWRLDRLGRTASGLASLFDELRERKINLVSIRDGIDLSTAAGRLMANVIASIAQYESELRSERTRAGHEIAWKKGKRWGGTKKGQRRTMRSKIAPVQKLWDNGKGMSKSAIARNLNISRPSVLSILRELKKQGKIDKV